MHHKYIFTNATNIQTLFAKFVVLRFVVNTNIRIIIPRNLFTLYSIFKTYIGTLIGS